MNTSSALAEGTGVDTWVYDQQHPDGLSTLKGDRDFKPPEADLPVNEQRRLSNTHHKDEHGITMVSRTPQDANEQPEQIIQRRRSSVSSRKSAGRRSSRKATGSYGDDSLKPLSELSSEEKSKVLNSTSNPLYFSEGLPSQ